MKAPIVCGIILGMLASSTITFAQATSGVTRDMTPPTYKKMKKVPVAKKPAVSAKSAPKYVNKSVAGAPPVRSLNLKPLYAQNNYGAPAPSTDASVGSGSANEKLMVNPPLMSSPATTTTAPLATTTPATKKSAFSFKWRSYNGENLNAIEMPNSPQSGSVDHEVQAWERFNIGYNISDNVSVSVMPQIFHTWFGDRDRVQNSGAVGYNQPYDFFIGDTGLYLTDSKLAQFGGFTLDGSQAYFFSTSEASIQAGTIGQTRTSLGLGRSFGPIDIKWTESFWYYMQTYETSSIYSTGGEPLQNLNYQLWSLLDLGWNVTKKFSINLESGFMNQVTDADDGTQYPRPAALADYIILDPEIDYSFNDHFTLGLGLWEQYDMRNQPVTVTAGAGASATPVAWIPQYYPFDYRNGTQAYLMTTIKF